MGAILKFIVAASKHQADLTATIWGWRQTARGWVNREGDEVRYVSHIEQLYGLQRGSVAIYRGHGWWANPELRGLEELCMARDYKFGHAND